MFATDVPSFLEIFAHNKFKICFIFMNRKRKFIELSPTDEGLTYYSFHASNHRLSSNLMENLKKERVKGSKILKLNSRNDVGDTFS